TWPLTRSRALVSRVRTPPCSESELSELGTIPDHASARGDGTVPQFQDHEFLAGSILVSQAPAVSPSEAESIVECRSTQYDDESEWGPTAGRQTLEDEAAADALSLMIRDDGERGQPDADSLAGTAVDLDRAERDVTDDVAIHVGHERNQEV